MIKLKVLYIEDNQIDQLAFMRQIREKKINYEYKIANSLAMGYQFLASEKFDIIISDYQLGDGTAFDLLEQEKDTPIIVATGEGTEEIAVQALKNGALDYLIKDLERNYLKVLPHTVENAIKLKNIEVEKQRFHSEIEESKKILEALFKGNPEPAIYLDHNYKVVDINPRFTKIFGYEIEEIRGFSINDYIVSPEFKKEAEDLKMELVNGPVYFETERLTKTGNLISVSISAAPICIDDKNLGTFVIYKDISKRKKTEQEKEKLIKDLKHALDEVKKLSGLIPICASCKKIRDDTGYWRQVEEYIQQHSDVDFSHSICPDCMKKMYPVVYEKIKKNNLK